MKRSALKASPLSLVPEAQESVARSQSEKTASLRDFYDGWLEFVSPAVLPTKTSETTQDKRRYSNHPLTAADVTRVALATVRESCDHRHWPPDVFRKFLVADVIGRKRQG